MAPLLVPAAHEIAPVDAIDDFYDEDFADISATSTDASSGVNLLAAAELAFARCAIDSAVVGAAIQNCSPAAGAGARLVYPISSYEHPSYDHATGLDLLS